MAAKVAAGGKGGKTALWSSLHHLRVKSTKAQESEADLWLQIKMAEGKSQKPYHWMEKAGLHPELVKTRKLVASRFYQLKVGHAVVEAYLYGIGVMDTPECW